MRVQRHEKAGLDRGANLQPPNRSVPLHSILIAIFLLTLSTSRASAHDPGLSSLAIRPTPDGVAAVLTFSRADIESLSAPSPRFLMDTDGDGQVSPAEFSVALPALTSLARRILEIEGDRQTMARREVSVALSDSDAVQFRFSFSGPHESHLRVSSTLLAQLPFGHRQFLVVQDHGGGALRQTMLDASGGVWEAELNDLPAFQAKPVFSQFLVLGVEHILTGFDHLLFLVALLVVGSTLREAAKIITAFTVAHSLTLALATLDLASAPASVIEPLIALSVIYVGLENVLRKEVRGRWRVTFVFGLIHGFGFASVLRELGIGSGSAAIVPLFSFNLGVELGQMLIAALALPLISKLRTNPIFVSRYALAASSLVILAGGYWFVERTMLR